MFRDDDVEEVVYSTQKLEVMEESYAGMSETRPGHSTPESNSPLEGGLAALTETSSPAKSRMQNLQDAQRSLSFKALALSTQANDTVSELYEKVRKVTVGEAALREEAALIERMHQITGEFFIGRATEKVLLRDVAVEFGLEVGSSETLRGARVLSVDPAGPAAGAGIRKGDIIASIDGRNAMGLDHSQVTKIIQDVIEEEKQMLVVSVAQPVVHGSVPEDEVGERAAIDRPKPPSYVVIRNKLRSEFGDAVYNRCKRRVQNHMSELSSRYDVIGGNRPATSTDRAKCYVNGQVHHLKEASRQWMTWARARWGSDPGPSYDTNANPYGFVDSPETQLTEMSLTQLDEDKTQRSRRESNAIRLQETLQDVMESEDPPEECRASGDDSMLPQLSLEGVKKFLARKHGREIVEQNMQHIRAKLQEREMMMISL